MWHWLFASLVQPTWQDTLLETYTRHMLSDVDIRDYCHPVFDGSGNFWFELDPTRKRFWGDSVPERHHDHLLPKRASSKDKWRHKR